MKDWIAIIVVVFLVGITLDETGFFRLGKAYNAEQSK